MYITDHGEVHRWGSNALMCLLLVDKTPIRSQHGHLPINTVTCHMIEAAIGIGVQAAIGDNGHGQEGNALGANDNLVRAQDCCCNLGATGCLQIDMIWSCSFPDNRWVVWET